MCVVLQFVRGRLQLTEKVLMTRVWSEDLAVQQVKFHSGARCDILRKEKQDRHTPGPNNAELNMHPLSKCLHKQDLQTACEFTQREYLAPQTKQNIIYIFHQRQLLHFTANRSALS